MEEFHFVAELDNNCTSIEVSHYKQITYYEDGKPITIEPLTTSQILKGEVNTIVTNTNIIQINFDKTTTFSINVIGADIITATVNCEKLYRLNTIVGGTVIGLFQDKSKLTSLTLTNIDNVTSLTNICKNCKSLTEVSIPESLQPLDCTNMFYGCSSLVDAPMLDLSKTKKVNYMYYGCTELMNVPDYNTENCLYFDGMLMGCTSLINVPILDMHNAKCAPSMFEGCISITEIPLLDFSNLTGSSGLMNFLKGCIKLETLPELDLSVVTVTDGMLQDCKSLVTIPALNLSKCISTASMFEGCNSLTVVNIKTIFEEIIDNRTIYTDYTKYVYRMFYGCSSLKYINEISTWETSAGESTKDMFEGCDALISPTESERNRLMNGYHLGGRGWIFKNSNLYE